MGLLVGGQSNVSTIRMNHINVFRSSSRKRPARYHDMLVTSHAWQSQNVAALPDVISQMVAAARPATILVAPVSVSLAILSSDESFSDYLQTISNLVLPLTYTVPTFLPSQYTVIREFTDGPRSIEYVPSDG